MRERRKKIDQDQKAVRAASLERAHRRESRADKERRRKAEAARARVHARKEAEKLLLQANVAIKGGDFSLAEVALNDAMVQSENAGNAKDHLVVKITNARETLKYEQGEDDKRKNPANKSKKKKKKKPKKKKYPAWNPRQSFRDRAPKGTREKMDDLGKKISDPGTRVTYIEMILPKELNDIIVDPKLKSQVPLLVKYFIAAISVSPHQILMDLLSLRYINETDKVEIIEDLRKRLAAVYEPSSFNSGEIRQYIDRTVEAVENIDLDLPG
jgi:hypothetical protein